MAAVVTDDTIRSLQIPLPSLSISIQDTIAAEVQHRWAKARRLREEAEAAWKTAQARFARQLLGEEA